MTQEFLYSVERVFDSAPATVWNAWVTADSLEAWYHPVELDVVPGSATSDAQIGGLWTIAIAVEAYDFVAYFYGRYLDVIDGSKLEHTLFYTQSAEEFAARDESVESHRIVVDFEARDGGTWVRFSQFGELPEGQAEQAQLGMESYFDSLETFLAL